MHVNEILEYKIILTIRQLSAIYRSKGISKRPKAGEEAATMLSRKVNKKLLQNHVMKASG